jgi:TatD DNase family protein
MLPFIDIHCHHKSRISKGHIEIYNAFLDSENGSAHYSLGIHPWFINREPDQIALLTSYLESDKDVIAIGECGLDYAIETPKAIQLSFFQAQISLAEKFKKPLIIHCVKAFDDLISLKKQNHADLSWVLHGFNKSPELASSLIDHGFYLSIGSKLCNNNRLEHILKRISLDRLFFETDNDEVNKIEDIYEKSARILELDPDELKKRIEMNFNSVFNEGQSK